MRGVPTVGHRPAQPLRRGQTICHQAAFTAAHVLNEDVPPHFEAHGAMIDTKLSNGVQKFCGRPDRIRTSSFRNQRASVQRTPGCAAPRGMTLRNGHTGRFRTSISASTPPGWYESWRLFLGPPRTSAPAATTRTTAPGPKHERHPPETGLPGRPAQAR